MTAKPNDLMTTNDTVKRRTVALKISATLSDNMSDYIKLRSDVL